ncbi:hypothetical protein HFE03_08085 [Paenibacillus sp. EKM102P]|uniref:hypothetical protein n=1 Tax=unclassified Paenibacillus TaxID=185978 RepID=UPI00142D612E|nr:MULTISPECIES: hypothetical protein [unclassified Paenibacillus]KAF6620601.1 hypothetical protein HFE00_05985 [Paenibacillus sp. EKM101P]KAF6623594.1 hypothetical protein HFE03_08085 [Paenibacillus sp. EKM102P]KAF6633845.1 hypothetical protein HFE01_06430 [Paenibacillus sp. EKM10P]KAF6649370.1 hypothetical protein HFE02_01385 [Paenibacillus sp. EKM11P]
MEEEYERLKVINDTLVNKGEYIFKEENAAQKFAREVLSEAENQYSDEGYYRTYEDFKDFLYTHHVDSIAYFIYEEKYSN